ncbi:hypothetical protein F2Q70_00041069 [Brassica cretica]|uniref:Uncharacterized protein n=1 Tax=Brassica cretica TaxID=69181 RepID=A0A8S9KAA5_BRACR|nr:hypothetical protein F2Q70_00041069 [Brassica cretica]
MHEESLTFRFQENNRDRAPSRRGEPPRMRSPTRATEEYVAAGNHRRDVAKRSHRRDVAERSHRRDEEIAFVEKRINRQILGREVPLYGPTILSHDEAVGILEWPHVSFNFIEGDEDASLTTPPQNYVIADADGRYISAFRPLVFQPGDEAYFVLGLPWAPSIPHCLRFWAGKDWLCSC